MRSLFHARLICVQGQWMWERKLSQEVDWTEYSRTEYSHASNVTTQDPDNFCLNIWVGGSASVREE